MSEETKVTPEVQKPALFKLVEDAKGFDCKKYYPIFMNAFKYATLEESLKETLEVLDLDLAKIFYEAGKIDAQIALLYKNSLAMEARINVLTMGEEKKFGQPNQDNKN